MRVCVCACVRECVLVFERAYKCESEHMFVRVCNRAGVGTCVCECLRVCVSADECVRECFCACVKV